MSYFLSTIPYNKLLHSPIIRRNSPSRGTSSPNSLTDFSKHSCSPLPMKAPKFLKGLVATLSGCREARTLKGFISPNGFQDRLLTNSHYTHLARLLPFFPVIDLTTNRQVCQTIQNSRTLAFSLRVIIGTFPYVAGGGGFEPPNRIYYG